MYILRNQRVLEEEQTEKYKKDVKLIYAVGHFVFILYHQNTREREPVFARSSNIAYQLCTLCFNFSLTDILKYVFT